MKEITLTEAVRIEATNFGEFCFKLQEMINKGYEIDKSNQGYPVTWACYYRAKVKLKEAQQDQQTSVGMAQKDEKVPTSSQKTKPTTKVGRAKKIA